MSRIIHTVRYINSAPIPRLDQIASSSGGTGTNHTHVNKAFLDDLEIDNQERLTFEHEIIPVPLLEDEW